MNNELKIEISYTLNEGETGCDYIQVCPPDQSIYDETSVYFGEDEENEALGFAKQMQAEYLAEGVVVGIVNGCK